MSNPVSEGEVEGRRERGGGGGVAAAAAAAATFLLSVGCCLPGKQEGIQSERETEREAGESCVLF